jgi:hypothetical protein
MLKIKNIILNIILDNYIRAITNSEEKLEIIVYNLQSCDKDLILPFFKLDNSFAITIKLLL